MAKNNKKAFVDAVRAKGGVRYFDLGGQATTVGNGSSQLNSGAGKMASGYGGLYDPNPANAPGHIGDAVGGAVNTVGGALQGVGTALTPQNQYQAQLAPTTQFDYGNVSNQAAGQSLAGYGQYQGNLANEQALQSQLMAQGMGQGPNPAQAALNQQTGTNVANQAALMASQRGGSANAGLIGRQAAQQGASTQQQAVGQSATLQAQQQLAAQQGAAALQGQIGSQIGNQQAASNQLFGIGAGANNTQNANLISNYGQAQGINSQVAQNNTNAVNNTMGGIFNGGSSLLSSLFAHGGEVGAPQKYAEGGPVSWAGQFLNSTPNEQGEFAIPGSVGTSAPLASPTLAAPDASAWQVGGGKSSGGGGGGGAGALMALLAKGGKVKSMVSPGEKVLPPDKVGSPDPLKDAVTVPGKAKVKGDSLKNDVVPADLPEGAIVLPRSVTQHKDAPRKAADFVRAIQAKQGLKRGKK